MTETNDQVSDKSTTVAGAAGAERCIQCDSVMRNGICPKGCETTD